MLKKVFFHSILYSLSSIIIQASSVLMLPLLTPHLTAFDYGVYGILMSYLVLITSLKDLGFGVVFVNSYYRYPKRWPIIWRMLYGHLIFWSVLYLFLQVLVLYIALPKGELHNFKFILLLTAMPSVLFETSNMIGNYYYRFRERPKVIAVIGLAAGMSSLVATYYCIVVLKWGYMGWFVGSFVSSFVMFICYFYPVHFKIKLAPILRFRKHFISRHLKVSLPMIPHNYSSYLLNSSDRMVMDWYKINLNEVGLYNIAYRFGNALEMMGEAVGMAVGPQYVKLYTRKSYEGLFAARRLTFFLMATFLSFAFLLSLWLKEIFGFLIHNSSLVDAYGLGIIIIMGYSYRPMYWATVNKLGSFDRTNVLWRISFMAGLLNLVLNLAFMLRFGVYGAAVITFISLMFVGFSGFHLKAYRKLEGLNHYSVLWLSLVIVATVLVYCLKDLAILFKTIITLVVCSVLFFVVFIEKVFKVQHF